MRAIATRALTPLATLLLVFQTGIVVTGGIVRVTGSGLGCPTWPECTQGSITPIKDQVEGAFHSWIEFGNRLLTVALVVAAALVLLSVLITKRKDLRLLALGQVAGIFGQALLGGVTVLTDLNPIPVAGHFLLSILLIAAALSLRVRSKTPTMKVHSQDRKLRLLARSHIYLTTLVLIVGTVVTGTGPHAGDPQAPRFPFSEQVVSWIHADLVIALLALTIAFFFASEIRSETKRRVQIFLIAALSQGAIGYFQYFLGLPELIVILHLLGSTLVWIAAWRIWLSLTTQQITRSN